MVHAVGETISGLRPSKARTRRTVMSGVNCGSLPSKTESLEKSTASEYDLLKDFATAFTASSSPAGLVFGDSVFLRVADDDESSLSLSEILRHHYKSEVFVVAGSGYHAGVFEQFATLLSQMPSRPRFAVIPINLRSFSPTWDLNPLYQFGCELELLSAFDVHAPSYLLPNCESVPESDTRSILFECYRDKLITLNDFLDVIGSREAVGSPEWFDRINLIFQCHYACQVSPKHRKIQSIKNTILLLHELGVAVYCYVTPINHEAGSEYCGRYFAEAVRSNVSIVQREIESIAPSLFPGGELPSFCLDDFSFQFSRDLFFTKHNATEHLRFGGRAFLAERIIDAGRRLTNASVPH